MNRNGAHVRAVMVAVQMGRRRRGGGDQALHEGFVPDRRRYLGAEVVPIPDESPASPVHGELQTKHRIVNHEKLDFDGLIADRKYQFVFILPPTPIKGATGLNGCPIAVT